MKSRFVPPYYQYDLCLKLQTLKQGDKRVEDYYQELIIDLAHYNIHDDDQVTCARFFGGLDEDEGLPELSRIHFYRRWMVCKC